MTNFRKMTRVFLVVIMIIGISGVFSQAAAESGNQKINVNTASVEELTELKGIGQVTAESIVKYRQKNGSFSSLEDLGNVKGIGPKTTADIKDQVVFESASN